MAQQHSSDSLNTSEFPLMTSRVRIVQGGKWEPNKVHMQKRHMSDAYHRRVQKKWIKRFGTYWRQYLTDDNFLVDSNTNIIYCTAVGAEKISQLSGLAMLSNQPTASSLVC